MSVGKLQPFNWAIYLITLVTGFLLVTEIQAAQNWKLNKVKADEADELTIKCPPGFHIIITHGEYGNKDQNCSDVFNQYNLALKCNYKTECYFAKVDDGMKTGCPKGIKKTLDLHYACASGQNRLQYSLLTKEDNEHKLSCAVNAKLYIINATYSDQQSNCVIDVLDDVSLSCFENKCEFYDIFSFLIDTCPEVEKTLLIMYICKVEESLMAFTFEGRPSKIRCPENYVIDVHRANYSDPMHECKPNDDLDLYIRKKCSGIRHCMVEGTTFSQFPSGCGSDLTELQIFYRCVQVENTNTFTVFEHGLIDISCFRYKTLKIINARFGKKKKKCGSHDALENIKNLCEGENRCCGTANTKLLGESDCPSSGTQKLSVTYECVPIKDITVLEERKNDTCKKIRFKISSSFGDITSETIRQMDQSLSAMIGTSLPRLQQISMESFDGIVDYLDNIPSLKMIPESRVNRSGSFSTSAEGLTDTISRTESKYKGIVWFNNFIKDKMVLKDAHIDIGYLTELMTDTGVYVSSFTSLFVDHLFKADAEVDISILRFPDIENPYFLVYHVQILAWRVSDRLLFYEKTEGGLKGRFQSIKFCANEEYLATLQPDVIESAIDEATKLFE